MEVGGHLVVEVLGQACIEASAFVEEGYWPCPDRDVEDPQLSPALVDDLPQEFGLEECGHGFEE